MFLKGKLPKFKVGEKVRLAILKDTFENPVVITVLRNQIDFLRSYYLQKIAGGAYISFKKFLLK